MELEPGVEMNKQERTRILEWFRPPKLKALCPLFSYCSWERESPKLEKACVSVSVYEVLSWESWSEPFYMQGLGLYHEVTN
jgi:hypothetical protein